MTSSSSKVREVAQTYEAAYDEVLQARFRRPNDSTHWDVLPDTSFSGREADLRCLGAALRYVAEVQRLLACVRVDAPSVEKSSANRNK